MSSPHSYPILNENNIPSSPSYPLGVLAHAWRDLGDAVHFVLFTGYIVLCLSYLLLVGKLDPDISLFRLLRSVRHRNKK